MRQMLYTHRVLLILMASVLALAPAVEAAGRRPNPRTQLTINRPATPGPQRHSDRPRVDLVAVRQAAAELAQLRRQLLSDWQNDPALVEARQAARTAREVYLSLRRMHELEAEQTPEMAALLVEMTRAENELDDAIASHGPGSGPVIRAAERRMTVHSQLIRLRAEAMEDDPELQRARDEMIFANLRFLDLRDRLRDQANNHPALRAAEQRLADLRRRR